MFGGGSVEGDGVSLDGETRVWGEGLAVATLRDVRLFRCKRFEGCLFNNGREGTFTKKGLLFRLRSYCFGSLYREGVRNKGTSYNKGKTGVKTYAFQC